MSSALKASNSISPRVLYRRLYRELSYQVYEASHIQQAEKRKREEAIAKYNKQEYNPPKPSSISKRLAVCPLYDSKGLREMFGASDDIVLGLECLEYLKAQRVYKELFSRYNGKDFEDEERLRLTARRVGLEMPL